MTEQSAPDEMSREPLDDAAEQIDEAREAAARVEEAGPAAEPGIPPDAEAQADRGIDAADT